MCNRYKNITFNIDYTSIIIDYHWLLSIIIDYTSIIIDYAFYLGRD